MSITVQGEIVIYDDKIIRVGSGTTEDRPAGSTGMLRFNTTTLSFEGYNGTDWGEIGGGGGGTTDEFARTLAIIALG